MVTVVSTIKRAGCGGKRIYESFRVASLMAKRVRQQHDGAKVGPYRCRVCLLFHVGEL